MATNRTGSADPPAPGPLSRPVGTPSVATVKRKSFSDMACPIAQSLEILGEWWTPLILRDTVLFGITRFDELQNKLGIAPTVLTDRLHKLVEHGLLERRQYSRRPPRFEYVPTQAGRDTEPILNALADWGRRWTEVPEKPTN